MCIINAACIVTHVEHTWNIHDGNVNNAQRQDDSMAFDYLNMPRLQTLFPAYTGLL